MPGISFNIDTRQLQEWKAAFALCRDAARKQGTRLVNDMAFEFKKQFPEVIASRYTVRAKKFVSMAAQVEKAKPGAAAGMGDIKAVAGTVANNKRFSGFVEEITGERGHTRRRVITRYGRKGKSPQGLSFGWARIHNVQKGEGDAAGASFHVLPNTGHLTRLPSKQRLPALLAMIARGALQVPENYRNFIMKDRKGEGMYRLPAGLAGSLYKGVKRKEWDAYRRKAVAKGLSKIQQFNDEYVTPPRWDWVTMVTKKVQQRFTPEYIWKEYLERVLAALDGKRKS